MSDANRTSLWSRPVPTRLYATGSRRERARRATDVVLLAVCAGALLLLVQLSEPPSEFEKALEAVVAAAPSFLDIVWRLGVGLVTAWAILLLFASVVRARWDVLRDHVIALATAGVFASLMESVIGSDAQSLWQRLTTTGSPADVASVRMAVVTAMIVVASPHLAHPFRMLSRWLLGIGGLSLVMIGATTPVGAVIGALCGTAAACAVHLVFGSSGGLPSVRDVRQGLEELGVNVTSLSDARRRSAGVFEMQATDAAGVPMEVRVFGRDAWDSQLLRKAWRALWYRDTDALTLTRVQQVEHEGFVTLLAAQSGVPVHEVVRAGRTSGNDAILVRRIRGNEMTCGGAAFPPAVLDAAWDTVLTLGTAGFAHGDIAPGQLRVDDDAVVLDGLAGASVAASVDQRRMDQAQMLVTTALLAGADAAVASASRRLGRDELALVLPYLQPAGLGRRLRGALGGSEVDLDALRATAAEVAGVEAPKLARLRRVSTSTLVQAGLFLAAGYFLISTLAGVDFSQLADAFRDASIAILVVALVFGQVPRFAQAESTRAACPRPIAYGPVVLLQFAITFINLVIPSTAARVAVNIRFFQRQGIPPASAVSIGVLDSLANFAVQISILLSVAVFGFNSVDLHFDLSATANGGELLEILVAVLALAIVVLIVALTLRRVRQRVMERIRPWIRDAMDTVTSLRTPARVARLLGANFLAEVLFATTLGIVLAAFGQSLPLSTLLVINVSVALFAGLMPVPGGIGVAEAALVVGLTAAGIGEATAFAVAVAYRICTYYVPPIWGSVAFHRLERSGAL